MLRAAAARWLWAAGFVVAVVAAWVVRDATAAGADSAVARPAPVVSLARGPDIVDLSRAAEVLPDAAGELDVESVRRGAWRSLRSGGFPQSPVYWVHVRYTAPLETKPWYLFLGYKPTFADLYVDSGTGRVLHQRSGNAVAFDARPVRALGRVSFELPATAGAPADLYIRVETREPRIALAVDSFEFFWRTNDVNIALGAFVGGVLLSLLIASLVLAVMLRRGLFWTYAFYLFTQIVYRANDVGGALFLPDVPIPWARANVALDGISVAAAAVFVFSYLRPDKQSRWLSAANIAVAAVALGYAVSAIAGAEIPITWAWRFAFVYVPLWIITGLICWARGNNQGALFLLAWLSYLAGVIALNVLNLGVGRGDFAKEYLFSHAPYFGLCLEGVLLSLSLSFELRRTQTEKAHFAELAETDALTGIANRRAFNERIEREWARASRSGGTLTLVLFDVDCFKAYNDRYGHGAGDVCLRAVARSGANCVQRVGDLFARYGGEEFAAILVDTPLEGGITVAEIVRRVVADLNIAHEGSSLGRVSLSAGVAERREGVGSVETLVQAADTALYRAKARGRNRVGYYGVVTDAPLAELVMPHRQPTLTN